MTEMFQVMPPLSAEEYKALREDIRENGILVPVVQDPHGRIVDGHHRAQIATELGIDYPIQTTDNQDDDQLRDLAFALNLQRRHLTRAQRRELITREIEARPVDSDRAIGRRLGCDHKTVGAVRRELSGEIPHPEPVMTRAEAEARTAQINRHLDAMFAQLMFLAVEALSNKVSTQELIGAVTVGMRRTDKYFDGLGFSTPMGRVIFEPFVDFLIEHGDEIAVEHGPAEDDPTFKPYTAQEKHDLLGRLTAAIGGVQ